VGFGNKEGDFWYFARAENGERAKNIIWGWGRGRKETLANKPLDFENQSVRQRTELVIG